MPSLFSFSNELLYKTIDYLHPDDILNFSLSCKLIHVLANKDAVSLHLQRKKTYETMMLHGCHRHENNAHPLRLIEDICMDWRVGEYPKALTIECCSAPPNPQIFPDLEDREDTRRYQYARTEDLAVTQAIMQCIQGYIEEKYTETGFLLPVESVLKASKRGERGAMLALVLLFSPNLESIRLVQFSRASHLRQVISSMLDNWTPQARKALTKLARVDIGKEDSTWPEDFQLLMSFAALPSMRKIFGTGLDGFGEVEEWSAHHTSTVEVVTIRASSVRAEYLVQLLVGIRSLKEFTYEHARFLRGVNGMETHKIIAALLQYAKHSLEHLTLLGNRDDREIDETGNNGCLQGFNVLKDLCLSSDVYLNLAPFPGADGSGREAVQPLVNVLPPSIETVTVQRSELFGHALSFLVDLSEKKHLRLPRFNKLKFIDTSHRRDYGWVPAAKGVCERVGVKLFVGSYDG